MTKICNYLLEAMGFTPVRSIEEIIAPLTGIITALETSAGNAIETAKKYETKAEIALADAESYAIQKLYEANELKYRAVNSRRHSERATNHAEKIRSLVS